MVDALVGNWQTNGILTLHTGQPFTVTGSGCQGVWNRCQLELVAGTDPNAAPPGGRNPNEWLACRLTTDLRLVLWTFRSLKTFHSRNVGDFSSAANFSISLIRLSSIFLTRGRMIVTSERSPAPKTAARDTFSSTFLCSSKIGADGLAVRFHSPRL